VNYNNGQMTPMQPMQPMDQRMQQLQQMQQMGQQMQQMSPQVGMNQGGVAPNTRPMEPMAQQMAQQGRYGDSMLVHMNPVEVAGIASLSPTGSLTTNPMTGQPEAFLPFLVPLLGSLGGSALAGSGFATALGLGGLGSTAMGAIGSGLATTAVTGDIKKGLTAGLTGFGIGSALNAASTALAPGVEAAQTAVTEGTKQAASLGDAVLKSETALAGLTDGTAAFATEAEKLANLQGSLADVTTGSGRQVLQLPMEGGSSYMGAGVPKASLLQQGPPTASGAINPGSLEMAQNTLAAETSKAGQNVFGNFKDQPGAFTKEFGKNLLKPSSLLPIGVGEGQRLAMEAQEARDDQFGATEADRKRRLDEAQGLLDQSLGQVATDYGYDYGRSYQAGGITSVDPSDYQRRMADFQQMGMQQPVRMNEGGLTDDELAETRSKINDNAYGGAAGFGFNPAARQASLRGSRVVTPEELEGFRPGIDPEMSYFRRPEATAESQAATLAAAQDHVRQGITVNGKGGGGFSVPGAAVGPDMVALSGGYGSSSPNLYSGIGAYNTGASSNVPARVQEAQDVVGSQAVSQRKKKSAQKVIDEYEAEGRGGQDFFDQTMRDIYGGGVGMSNGGTVMMAGGDKVPTGDPAQVLIQQTAMALLGRMSEEESSVVIKRFVDEFGSEAFQQLRSQVLESVVPNSQKEGLIQGAGGGMDDQVGGMIGDQQPVAVSPGEFIVPGDVVSGLGDGDTSAGAKELAAMMDRVRTERTGTTEQPEPLVNVRGGGILPA
jgi:hypothetical protein